MRFIKLIIFFFILLPITAFATIDVLSVNKITKEYYWGDDDSFVGWIGWGNVSGEQFDSIENDLEKSGYTRTYYPYKIETFIIFLIAIIILGKYVKRKKLKSA
jgi:hypothetical protein